MRKALYILIMWLAHLTVFGQTDGYDPSNPPNPSVPEQDTTQYYALTVKSIPEGVGSFNTLGGHFTKGESVYLYAYSHDNCKFVRWIDDEGNTLSTNYRLYYTMPARNAVVTAVFEYNPSSPGNPEVPQLTTPRQLKLVAKPAAGGYFNVSGGSVTVNEGESYSVYAYNNPDFVFLRWENEAGEQVSDRYYYNATMGGKDVTYYAIFEYRPGNPGNPGSNAWDAFVGDLIIDDFQAGDSWSAAWTLLDKENASTSDVLNITLAGKANNNDVGLANNFSSCTSIDLTRTTGITMVPYWCYSGNSTLAQVYLPASVQTIENYAFNNCTALAELTCLAVTPPKVRYSAFAGVPSELVIRVPEGSISLYEAAEGWKDYQILPVLSNVKDVEICLPEECKDGRYKNMSLELVNVKSGQRYKYVVTDRLNYIYSNLMKNTQYTAYLKNLSGVVLARIDSIKVEDENLSFTFSEMKSLQTVSVRVLDAQQADVTGEVAVRWYDADGNYLSQDSRLEGQVEGHPVKVALALPQYLGMQYQIPADSLYDVQSESNEIAWQLELLPRMMLKGKVADLATKENMKGVTITVAQTLNGMYSKTMTAETDEMGNYAIEVFKTPATLTWSCDEYVSQSVVLEELQDEMDMGKTLLKSITGARIALSFTYSKSVQPTEESQIQTWYSDYNNITYALYNKTQNRPVSQFSVQYPTIVLLEEVNDEDVLQLTAMSKNNAFMPVVAETKVKDMQGTATFDIKQLGGVSITFRQTENASVVGMLYDDKGSLVKKSTFSTASLTMSDIADGNYTLLVMGESSFFNTFSQLSGFAEMGLKEGVDYATAAVRVESGIIHPVDFKLVPFFDESKLYYTGDNTSYTVNKQKVVAGTYLTLQAKIDFKRAYQSEVSNIQMVFDIPEGTSFVENSLMVGSSLSTYLLEDGKVTIDMEGNVGKRVRFCVIPTASGQYAPNAYVRFTLNGKTLTQPIGNAAFEVEDINLSVPSMVSRSSFSASGTAMGNCAIEVYDGTTLVGQTKSLANGMWVAECNLLNPTNLSSHAISAKVTTKNGLVMTTETIPLVYDENCIEISQVRMYHWNPEMNKNYEVVYDFQQPSTVAQKYTYYIYNRQFTFTINFTDNNPDAVHNVKLRVRTGDGSWTTLPATFDSKKACWVANGEFGNYYDGNVPKNVAVAYEMTTPFRLDANVVDNTLGLIEGMKDKLSQATNAASTLIDQLVEAYCADSYNDLLVQQLEEQVYGIYGLTEEEPARIESEEDARAFMDEIEAALSDSIYHMAEQMIAAQLDSLYGTSDYAQQISLGTCDGLEESAMEENGFMKLLLNDSTAVYCSVTEDKVTMVSFKHNYRADILLESGSEIARMMTKANNRDEFLAAADRFIAETERVCNDINTRLNNAKDFIENYQKALVVAYGIAKQKFSKTLATVKELASMTREGNPVPGQSLFMNDLKNTAKKSGKIMTGARIAGSKIGSAMNSPLGLAAQKLVSAFDIVNQLLQGVSDLRKLVAIYKAVPQPCEAMPQQAQEILTLASYYGMGAIGFYGLNIAADIVAIKSAVAAAAALAPSGGTSALVLIGDLSLIIVKGWACDKYHKDMEGYIRDLRARLRALKCKNGETIPDVPIENEWHYSDEPDADVSIDPSGYVYEGVSSNRLQGVTATCYYKEEVEDIYGDKHENIVLWDAEEYAQQNPLFTDEMGMYRWDVPQGLWQVKFEKEGYVTTYSDWLPVPPPQLEVNIPMVQNVQPEVISAKAYEDEVEIAFSKYMKPETLTSDNLCLQVKNGDDMELIPASIELLDTEAVNEKDATEYASKVALKPTTELRLLEGEVYVIISNKVQSYAGIQMVESFTQKLDIVKKIRKIEVDETVNVAYEQQETLTIGVLPGDASKGKKLVVKSASEMIATVTAENAVVDEAGQMTIVLDENGQAVLQVNGELLGSTALSFSVEDAEVTAQTAVNVVEPAKLDPVKDVVASRVSGSELYRGQTISLSCETEGATVYYTLDGSCPCDEATRLKYEGRPIAVNGNVAIKAMAVGINGTESEVKEFSYTIKQTSMQIALAEGWNWTSHNQASDLEASRLQTDGISRVVSFNAEMVKDPTLGFVDNIGTVKAEEAVKIQATQATSLTLSGEMFNPNAISLVEGWNWLGYPMAQTMEVGEALALLEAEEGDRITYLGGGFAEYSNGAWTGSLTTMSPGQGYLYKSVSGNSFLYNDAIVSKAQALNVKRLEVNPAPWSVDVHQYPDMMCVTALLYDGDEQLDSERYHLGAFVGDECRGVAKCVKGLYFLSVYGDMKVPVTFVAIDKESGETFVVDQTADFVADVLGSVATPYVVNISPSTGIGNLDADGRSSDDIYNMLGQKVERMGHTGIYVVGGKKRVISKFNAQKYAK